MLGNVADYIILSLYIVLNTNSTHLNCQYDSAQSLMGDNRQRYQAKLQERLKNRKKRIQDGEDVDDGDEGGDIIDEDEAKSTGNILRDLQLRYEQEKEALLRKLQVDI